MSNKPSNPADTPLTLTFTVHEWRLLATAAFIGSRRMTVPSSAARINELAERIATETGKYPPTPDPSLDMRGV